MKTAEVVLSGILLIVIPPAAQAFAETTVVVNFGPRASAQAAGHSEAKVDWLDADTTDDTVCTECFAALELQRYLRKMTARANDFAIVDDGKAPPGELILVGGPASNTVSRELAERLDIDAKSLSDLGPEGYRIKSSTVDSRRVTLVAGGSRVGTLYGSYDLLYRVGCRWFAPGEVHEVVPHIERIPGFDVTERPGFLTRGFLAWQDRGNPDFLHWMARNRLNEWCVEQSGHPLMFKLGIRMVGGLHDAEARFINPQAPYPYDHSRFEGDSEKPKDPYPAGDQYQGDANTDGKLAYFEAHPEWFALVDNRRIPGIRGGAGTNFCTSNPHAVTEFMKNFVREITDGPYRDATVIRFWTLDGGKWCQCGECKKLGIPTDRNLLLVHRLDQEIKKAQAEGEINRSVAIRFLTYADVLHPPTRPLPKTFDYATCAATFYPIGRSYVYNFDDSKCDRNTDYRKQLYGWVTEQKRFYRGQLVIGEYYNVSGFKCLPICFMHTMANDIPYYYKVGARYFQYMHVSTGNWGSKALTNYQMARQLWDVDTDCQVLWKDYFTQRYGPAADTMRRFYESLQKTFCNVRELKYGLARRLDRGSEDLFPTPQLRYRREPGVDCDGPALLEIVAHARTCRELISQARGAELPERIMARIAEDERLFTYGERTIGYLHACVEAFQLARANKPDEARRHFAEAKRLAGLLRKDTASTSMAGRDGSAADAFVATYATGALKHLAGLLGPDRSDATKRSGAEK